MYILISILQQSNKFFDRHLLRIVKPADDCCQDSASLHCR